MYRPNGSGKGQADETDRAAGQVIYLKAELQSRAEQSRQVASCSNPQGQQAKSMTVAAGHTTILIQGMYLTEFPGHFG